VGYHSGGSAFSRSYAKARAAGKKPLSIRGILLKNVISSLAILSLGLSYIFMELFFGFLHAAGVHNRLFQTAIYAVAFLVYPVYLLGQTVPLVSNYFSQRNLSEITGKMLFFSTTGSFMGSVFSTIVLMMTIGVNNTVIVTMGLLSVLAILLIRRWLVYEVGLCGFILGMLYLLNNNDTMRALNVVSDNAYNIVKVETVDDGDSLLFDVNRSSSSKISSDPEKMFVYWQYVEKNFIKPISEQKLPPKDILILGAGGFTIGLHDTHNRYVFLDIDKALKEAAEKHFLKQELTPNKRFVASSARGFVANDDKKYDLILIDAYTNVVSIPMEAITREFLLDVKAILKEDGVVIANVISNPTFADKFSVRYTNTFASVFPVYTRQVIGDFNAWADTSTQQSARSQLRNILFIYYNRALTQDRRVYTDDLNTYSIDR